MTRRTRYTLIALALVGLGAAWLGLRAKPAVDASPAPTAVALELAPGDWTVARSQTLTRGVPVSGGLRAADSALVKAKVAAEIERLAVREGDAVQAGQVIGQLDTREVRARLKQAREQAASARAQLDIAQRTLDNNQALVNQGFISKNALDTSVSNAAAARANLQAAEAAAELAQKAQDDAVLRAPIKGFVSQRFAQTGERVGVDARIVEIVDLSRIELEAALSPLDVAEVRVGQSASLRVDGLPQPVAARVVRISPAAQSGTRAVMVYLALASHPALRQGLFATGQIALEQRTALTVPQSSVRLDQADPYVLVIEGSQVKQRDVKLGARGEIDSQPVVEVAQGVTAGSRVLSARVGLVRDGTAVSLPREAATSPSSAQAPATPASAAR